MTVDEAKEAYRAAWSSYCLCTDPETKLELERTMDHLQPKISPGPDEHWRAFAASLPGFLEFWGRWRDEALERIEEL
jgi:predicted secreted Zn-dependent protease